MLTGAGTGQVHYYFYYVEGYRAGEAQLHSDGSLWAIEIYPDYRGKGHGEKLVQGLLDAAYTRGHGGVWLFVHPENIVATNLYLKLGFVSSGTTKRGMRMTKRLVA